MKSPTPKSRSLKRKNLADHPLKLENESKLFSMKDDKKIVAMEIEDE
jgi:hypothetical protein